MLLQTILHNRLRLPLIGAPPFTAISGDRAWKDIRGAGRSVGGIHEVGTAGVLVDGMEREFQAARGGIQCA